MWAAARSRDHVSRALARGHGEGVEEGAVPEREAEPVEARAQDRRQPMHAHARCARSPTGPWYTAYMDAITASSTCAVQMFEVAFSRRMCCSRVCSARR